MRRVAGLLLAVVMLLPVALRPGPVSARPAVAARTWVIMDAGSGEVIDGLAPHQRTAMASLTKVMTGLVAVERGDVRQQVTIFDSDRTNESSAGLVPGETDSLWTLLHGMLLPSGNDAANAVARAVGGSPSADSWVARNRFVGWMNDRAASLGLRDTHFVNPHGLDAPGHYSSVYDLAVITRAALAYPDFVEPFGAATYSGDGHDFTHLNKLPQRYPGIIGGKTGWTDDAGLCLIEVAQRGDRRLIVVLIGSTFEDWYDDAAALLDYGFWLPEPATTASRAAAVFAWWRDRTDAPVGSGVTQRSWVWGPKPLGPVRQEPYAGSPGGQRYVAYFDKGRMEVNDPAASLTGGWYVTGGRLAWELITGRRQTGDDRFEQRRPADVPLAGDLGADTPTYATLGPLLAAPPLPAGAPITARLLPGGGVVPDDATAGYGVTAGDPSTPTGHGVASIFRDFLGLQGPVIRDGRLVDAPLFDPPFSVTGYPITEAYWLRVPVGGVSRDVLVQCFERRCLTYTPANPEGWQVEMANIGLAYWEWLTPRATEAVPTMRRFAMAPSLLRAW